MSFLKTIFQKKSKTLPSMVDNPTNSVSLSPNRSPVEELNSNYPPLDMEALRKALLGDDNESLQLITRWIESGADIEWKGPNGFTLLHLSARFGNERMVRFLLEHGADVNSLADRDETPLIMAVDSGWNAKLNPKVVSVLLDHSSDPNLEDCDGNTPLSLVSQFGLDEAKEIAYVLIQGGAEQIPGKNTPCPECGAPESLRMRGRGIDVTLEGTLVNVPCLQCNGSSQIPIESISKSKGIRVECPDCNSIVFIPPSIWCSTCGKGLSSGWQDQVSLFG